ncbi:phage holin family protein [Actinosynnema sp. NPDC020468]|uniref:phage holin family protein n=1 Tax=Actinosynnema sp. NPDC020468 TaxID=3154488 RepID=UPI0033F117E0
MGEAPTAVPDRVGGVRRATSDDDPGTGLLGAVGPLGWFAVATAVAGLILLLATAMPMWSAVVVVAAGGYLIAGVLAVS